MALIKYFFSRVELWHDMDRFHEFLDSRGVRKLRSRANDPEVYISMPDVLPFEGLTSETTGLQPDELINSTDVHSNEVHFNAAGPRDDTVSLPMDSQQAYLHWEHGTQSKSTFKDDDSDFATIDPTNPSILVRRAPGDKFDDSLNLDPLPLGRLQIDSVRRYKNNLVCIFESHLVVASNSKLFVFPFEAHVPRAAPCLIFDTRPTFTSQSDRTASTWPHFPHTINFLKSSHFAGGQIIGACLDDGTLRFWFAEAIFGRVNPKGTTPTGSLSIAPTFTLKLTSSVWGLDFKTYTDSDGNTHSLVLASDNSQMITLFYYHKNDSRFYHVQSSPLTHNIPEVSFISVVENNGLHTVEIGGASISGDLAVLAVNFEIKSGPLNGPDLDYFKNKPHYVAMVEEDQEEHGTMLKGQFHRISFLKIVVKARTFLDDDCWTVKPVLSANFNQVRSISAVFGNLKLSEEDEITRIVQESNILDLAFDPVETSHLGLAAEFQHYETPTILFSRTKHESARFITESDQYERINQWYSEKNNYRERTKSANGISYRVGRNDLAPSTFLLVSTTVRFGLFKTDLICNAATKTLFDLPIPFNEDSRYANRISISHIIPQLQCVIVISQQGLCSILRLCVYRGVYGFRQEHIFPNAVSLALGRTGFRTIVGVGVRDMSPGVMEPRFLVYVIYSDGVYVGYELTSD